MSDDTEMQTPENETPEITITFAGYGKPLTLVSTKPRKKKGSDEHFITYLPKLEGEEVWNFLKTVVPVEKLNLALFNELIKPAASEATSKAAGADPNTGEPTFDEAAYAEEFLDQFNPASRRSSGPSKKDLEARMSQLGQELWKVTLELQANPADTAARNRTDQLMVEMTEINMKLEAKRRGPQVGRKKKAAAAAA